jgi:hypothetical protein
MKDILGSMKENRSTHSIILELKLKLTNYMELSPP